LHVCWRPLEKNNFELAYNVLDYDNRDNNKGSLNTVIFVKENFFEKIGKLGRFFFIFLIKYVKISNGVVSVQKWIDPKPLHSGRVP
jgi:hypothetical protein